jgi:hypothetical protein
MDDFTANQVALGMLSPEARAAMTGTMPQVTLRDARNRLENAVGLSKADERALKNWVSQYELREEAARQHLISQSLAGDTERATDVALRARERENELAELRADVERGRRTPDELRQAALDVDRLRAEMLALAEGMGDNYASREALKESDLADLQDQRLNRLPALRDRLPGLLGEFGDGPRSLPAGQRRPANVNPAASIQGHADELFRATRDAVRALEEAEARAKALSGPKDSDLMDRFPSLRSHSA